MRVCHGPTPQLSLHPAQHHCASRPFRISQVSLPFTNLFESVCPPMCPPSEGAKTPRRAFLLNPSIIHRKRLMPTHHSAPTKAVPHLFGAGTTTSNTDANTSGATHARTHSRRRAQEHRQLTYQHATQHTTAPHTLFLPLGVTTLIRNTADKKSVSLEQEQRQQ